MILVLANNRDLPARRLVETWRAHDARLITLADLSRAGWRHYLGEVGPEIAIACGELIPAASIKGVDHPDPVGHAGGFAPRRRRRPPLRRGRDERVPARVAQPADLSGHQPADHERSHGCAACGRRLGRDRRARRASAAVDPPCDSRRRRSPPGRPRPSPSPSWATAALATSIPRSPIRRAGSPPRPMSSCSR